MADLGSLYFDILLRDKTAAERKKLKDDLEKDLKLKIGIDANTKAARQQLAADLISQPFKIGIVVDKASATQAVQQALQQVNRWNGKFTADDLRAERAKTQQAMQQWRHAQAELARVRQEHYMARDAANAHASASLNLGGAMGSNIKIAGELGATMAGLYSIHALQNFLANVVEIGGELEHQKIAMDTIFGDKGKTIVLYDQIKDLARNSPFGVMELTSMVKSLSAYGVEYNEIYDTAKRLADISAATSVDINRLILAFGKTRSRSFLDGLEAKQFAYANIPIYDMLSKKLTEVEGRFVSVKDVMERISKREISFDMVKDVLWDMTDEGGKFYNMQEQLAGSVKIAWKLVKDNIELMYGDMAEDLGGPLKAVAHLLQYATREWKVMGTAIAAAVALMGVHRVAQSISNMVIGKSAAAKYQAIMAEKAANAENLRALGLTQALTAAEQEEIINKNRLAKLEFEQLLIEERLNSVDIIRLATLGKLKQAHLDVAVAQKILTQNQANAITQGRIFGVQMGRTGNIIRAAGMGIASVAKSIGSFFLNPWTLAFAAISGIVGMLQKQREQAQQTKELCDNMFTKAREGAESLKETLAEIPKNFATAATHEVTQFIEKMKAAIKDYAVNPEYVIAEASLNDDGTPRSQKETAEELRKQLELLERAKALQADWNLGEMWRKAASAADGGWFDDDVTEDLKDYAKAYEKAEEKLTEYTTKYSKSAKNLIKFAMDADPEFRKYAASCSAYQQQLELLTRQASKFSTAWRAIRRELGSSYMGKYDIDAGATKTLAAQWNTNSSAAALSRAKDEAMRQFEATMNAMKAELARKGVTFSGGEMILAEGLESKREEIKMALRNMATEVLADTQSLSEAHQQEFRDAWNKMFGLDFDASVAVEAFRKAMEGKLKDLPEQIRNAINSGSVDKLPLMAQEQVKAFFRECIPAVEREYPYLSSRIQGLLNDSKFRAEVLLSFNTGVGLSDWQKELNEKWGGNNATIKGIIKAEPDMLSTMAALAELYKKSEEILKKKGALKLPFTPTFEGKLYSSATIGKLEQLGRNDLAQFLREFNDAQAIISQLDAGEKATGIDLSVFGKKERNGGKKEDKYLKQMKERFNLLKKACDEYKKWLDIVGADAAALKVKESGIFDQLFEGKNMTDVSDYKGELQKILKELEPKANTTERRELVVSIKTLLNLDIPRDEEKKALEEMKTRFENEASRIGKQWDLFGQLVGAGVSRSDAQKQAFGTLTELKGKGEALRDQLVKALGNRGLSIPIELSEDEAINRMGGTESPIYKQFFKAWKDAKEAIEKDSLDIQLREVRAIAKYKSTSEKIASLSDEYSEYTGLKAGANGELMAQDGMTAGQKAMFEEYKEKLAELKGELLSLLPEWQQIFGDHTYKSYEQVMNYRNMVGEMVSNAKVHKNKDGKPTSFTSSYTKADGTTQEITGSYAELEKLQRAIASLYKTAEGKNPFKALGVAIKELKNADSSEGAVEAMRKVCDAATSCKEILNGVGSNVKEVFEAMGNQDAADATDNVMAVLDSAANIGQGFAKGGLIGGIAAAAGEALKWTAKLLNAQSENITRAIKESQRQVAHLEAVYSAVERSIKRFLGNPRRMPLPQLEDDKARLEQLKADPLVNYLYIHYKDSAKVYAARREMKALYERMAAYDAGGAYAYMRQLKIAELAEKQSQLQSALSDKNKDKRKDEIAQLRKEIPELQDEIRTFSEDIASELYGINLGEWASQIGDALFEAWKRGEDGAEAFKNTVGEIMGSVTNSMLQIGIIKPMMEDLQLSLFGADGKGGMFGSDFDLSEAEIATIADKLVKTQDQTKAYTEAMDRVEKLLNDNYGISLKGLDGKDGGLSKGIQSVTESTADLLSSYINAIRADVSVERESLRRIAEEALPEFNVLAEAQLRQLETIANNTGRNAAAAEAILSALNNNIKPGAGFRIA